MKRSGFTQHHFFKIIYAWVTQRRQHKSGAGFTLVELLVYLGITSIALVVFMNFMVGIFANARRADAVQQQAENGRLIIAKMTQASRFANSFTVAGNQVDIVSPSGTTTYTLTDMTLYENGSAMHTGDVRITSFLPTVVGTSTLNVSLEIDSTTPAPSHPAPVTLTTSLTARQSIYQ